MSDTDLAAEGRHPVLGRRNLLVLAAAMAALAVGYALLAGGSTSSAAVLLVLGYVVLFPLAVAL